MKLRKLSLMTLWSIYCVLVYRHNLVRHEKTDECTTTNHLSSIWNRCRMTFTLVNIITNALGLSGIHWKWSAQFSSHNNNNDKKTEIPFCHSHRFNVCCTCFSFFFISCSVETYYIFIFHYFRRIFWVKYFEYLYMRSSKCKV